MMSKRLCSTPLVSIIIPIYNTDKDKLLRCLNSIALQSYQNYELLLVFNGCETMYLDNFAKQTLCRNVKIFIEKTASVSKARNIGINNSCGDYVVFVDADDELLPDAINKGISYITKYNADLVSAGFKKMYYTHEEVLIPHISNVSKVANESVFYHLLSMGRVDVDKLGNYLYASPWAKIYSRTIIGDIRFNESLYYMEDILFNLRIVLKCKNIILVPECWYLYYQSSDSAIHSFTKKLYLNLETFVSEVSELTQTQNKTHNLYLAVVEYLIFSIRQVKKTGVFFDTILNYVKFICDFDIVRESLQEVSYHEISGGKKLYFFMLKMFNSYSVVKHGE